MIHSRDLPPALRERLGIKARGSKYKNRKTVVDGIKFDSIKESVRYDLLKRAKADGYVKWFLRQVPFRLPGGTIWRADFLVVWKDGSITIEDVKGYRTQVYKIKKREVEAQYGIEIVEI